MFDLIYLLWIFIGIALICCLIILYMIYPQRTNNNQLFAKNFAHRGIFNNVDVPENSILAFKKAIDKGYGIELDIRLTKDHQLIVFHDHSFKRMCHQIIDVNVLTLSEIRELRLLNTDQKIPTFEEVLSLVNGKVPLLIEIKTELPGFDVDMICEKAAELLSKYSGEYYIESFDYNVLKWYKKNQPNIKRGQIAMGFQCYIPAMGKELAEKIPLRRRKMMSHLFYNFKSRPHFVAYRYQDIGFIVKLIKFLGVKVFCWTVTKKEVGEDLLQKYDAIIFEQYLI